MNCPLHYIPEHLHLNDKPIIPVFIKGEKLYYRCKPENLKKPYDNISLRDISHNRNFNDDLSFPKENVFFNVDFNDERETYDNLEIVTLQITNLQKSATYFKEITSKIDNSIKVLITLIHSPHICMYPHSAFEIRMNETIINNENYENTLGKRNKLFSSLRSEIRQELTLIIQNNSIDSSLETEYIYEP